ncbi:hypothetical protein EVAR_48863_1 [Eumeta japonica]|uniref:Uncharacterized protein n=1 Tax=Eumeta variegata TaxID=151549 RepID=A0A4C1Y4Q8_EUMVA|nr:hypothetical protein EVAR_48863_1 [Eumeta japonica]
MNVYLSVCFVRNNFVGEFSYSQTFAGETRAVDSVVKRASDSLPMSGPFANVLLCGKDVLDEGIPEFQKSISLYARCYEVIVRVYLSFSPQNIRMYFGVKYPHTAAGPWKWDALEEGDAPITQYFHDHCLQPSVILVSRSLPQTAIGKPARYNLAKRPVAKIRSAEQLRDENLAPSSLAQRVAAAVRLLAYKCL